MSNAASRDVRHALRYLWGSRGFSAAAILTLALALGATAAMFSLQNALVLRRLPIPDPDGLVAASARSDQQQLRLTPIPAADELAKLDSPFREVCGYNSGVILAVGAGNNTSQAVGALVTGRCFETIGVMPALGRAIGVDDAPIYRPGNFVTVISHRLWVRLFGADPSAIGRTVRVEGAQLTVIGVMPQGFDGIDVDGGIDLYAPYDTIFPARADRRPAAAYLVGRLKDGVPFDTAAQRLIALWPAMLENIVPASVPAAERTSLLEVQPRLERLATGLSAYRTRYAQPVAIMFGLAATLLLLACFNLGGLLLSRALDRRHEMTVRLALGGSRWQMSRLLLIESVMLAIAGALLAVPFAYGVINLVTSFLPPTNVARAMSLTPDRLVVVATLAAGVVAGVLMGILPMLVASPREHLVALRSARTVARSSGRWLEGLVVAQVALSIVLVVGAGLLARSLYLINQVDPGVRAEGLMMVRVTQVPNGYATIDNAAYYPPLLDRIRALPGVDAVALGRAFPRMFVDGPGQQLAVAGDHAIDATAHLEITSPDYFSTLGIPLLKGRTTTWDDNARSPRVVVVNQRLATLIDADGDVIGKRISLGTDPIHANVEIVGVVRNATMGNPRSPNLPVFYRPALQVNRYANYGVVLFRADPRLAASLAASVRQMIEAGGHEFVPEVSAVSDVLERAPASERMSATLAIVLGAIAVVLAFVGVFAVLAYDVIRRMRELGVRTAIGASPITILKMVLGHGLVLTAIGVMMGLPAAYAGGRVLSALLFGISGADTPTFAAAAILFLLLGGIAGIVPARRAAGVDPIIALRSE